MTVVYCHVLGGSCVDSYQSEAIKYLKSFINAESLNLKKTMFLNIVNDQHLSVTAHLLIICIFSITRNVSSVSILCNLFFIDKRIVVFFEPWNILFI